jgi:hypothetical protein
VPPVRGLPYEQFGELSKNSKARYMAVDPVRRILAERRLFVSAGRSDEDRGRVIAPGAIAQPRLHL